MKNTLSQMSYYIIVILILFGLLMMFIPVSNTSGKYVFSSKDHIQLEIKLNDQSTTDTRNKQSVITENF